MHIWTRRRARRTPGDLPAARINRIARAFVLALITQVRSLSERLPVKSISPIAKGLYCVICMPHDHSLTFKVRQWLLSYLCSSISTSCFSPTTIDVHIFRERNVSRCRSRIVRCTCKRKIRDLNFCTDSLLTKLRGTSYSLRRRTSAALKVLSII